MRRYFTFLLISLSIGLISAQTTIQSEDFSSNTSGTWTAVNVLGATDVWGFSSGYATINGFGDENDEDWLVSPSINMDNATGETFTFKSRNRYGGPMLELYYTTTYTGNPADAGNNWVAVPLTLTSNTSATQSASFTQHSDIDVSAVSGTNVRFAFKYYGTSALTKEWQIDDILLRGFTACNAPTTAPTSPSFTATTASVTLSWTKGDGTNSLVLFSATDAFTEPTDGTTYTANTTYSGSTQQTVFTGTGNSVTVTGLSASTSYFIRIYNFNTCATPIDYYTTSFAAIGATTSSSGGGGGTGEPVGYYNAANNLTCEPKRTALRTIITTGHTDRGYSGLWTVYATSDVRPGTNRIWDIYTDKTDGTYCASCPLILSVDQDGGSGGAVECDKYNREHTIPQSWFADASPMRNDPHHVLPTDKKVNNVRGNDPYGMVSSASYTSCNGSKYGSSTGAGSVSGTVFEPLDEYKGDIARIYFYMATRYGSVIGGWASNTAEAASVISSSTLPVYKQAYVNMLIGWHNADPVSQKEIDRNNAIYTFQGNRNPYIDHPEYVAQVWGTCVIPVTLIDFKGIFEDKKVKLTWLVENEIQFSHYEIERQNTEGGQFVKIGTVAPKQLREYGFEDTNLNPFFTTKAYYRLKMVDKDGSFTYSKIVAVELPTGRKNTITVYPNPANQTVTLNLGTAFTGLGTVEVFDILGKSWFTTKVSTPTTSFDFQNLPNGNYYIRALFNGATYQERLIIAH